MKVTGLDGRAYNWNLSQHTPLVSEQGGSSYHKRCRQLLYEIFKCERILEELVIPGTKLSLDFFLPNRMMAVEVQGEQHKTKNKLFHNANIDFVKQLQRDMKKREWCELNNISLIELDFDETEEEWKCKLLNSG